MSNISFSSGYGEYVSGEFLGGLGFELKSNDRFIFFREFQSNSSSFVDLNDDTFKFTQHNFVTGEELIYNYESNTSNNPIKIAPTIISGITTDILPRTLYAIKVDFSTIRVAATKQNSLLVEPVYLNLTQFGKGRHSLASKNPNKNSIITINNVIQDPIVSTSTTSFILESITNTDLSVTVNEPEKFVGGDLFKIDDEYFRVLSVGVGTTNNLFFERGLLGTNPTPHNSNAVTTKIKGSYNITESFIYFTQPPYGNFFDLESGLTNNSTFSGRVFLRSGKQNTSIGPYDSNFIADDISPEFDGTTDYFELKEDGSNIVGVSTDNAIVTVNDIFQSPSRLTGNPIIGSYVLGENAGITTITFTGNTDFAEYDVNLSELPRGGIIFSVGSTEGFGYQPLISAGGTAVVSTAGTIQSISIGYSGSGYRSGIQTVNVGVGYSDVVNFDLEIIGTATISNGGITTVVITNPGSGYTSTNPPSVYFDSPLSYSNLPLIYSSSSSGVGTEATISIVVGQGSSIIDFNLENLGYAYKKGDILTVAGIPTTGGVNFKEFQIFVDEVFNDDSTIRTIGELIIFDPIDNLFNSQRRVFPLRINGDQTAVLAKVGSDLEVQNSLLIFIDTVLQVPGESYTIKGGSILTFNQAPREGSKSTILFYGGTRGIDTEFREIIQTVKIGDNLTIFDTDDRFKDQNARTVNDIISVDAVRTNVYNKQGISVNDEIRPVKWCPQNVDKFIAGSGSTVSSLVSKDRVIYEPLIYPSTFAISGIGSTSSEIFVDNVKTFFDNLNESPITNDITIISQVEQRPCVLSANVSAAGTISSVDIVDSGIGYFSTPQISFSSPVGMATTATGSVAIDVNGSVISVNIINSGVGYGTTAFVIVESPRQKIETAKEVSYEGDFGIISGIGTTTGSVIFDLYIPEDSYLRDASINQVGAAISGSSGISSGYYFYASNTNIGGTMTSLDSSDNVIGISTQFIDNVYQVVSATTKQKVVIGVGLTTVSEVVVKVSNNSPLVGVAGSGYYGDYSWGRIFNVSKSGFNEFVSYAPGITTSTIIQRLNPLKYLDYLV
jgi:hypothetical protein